MIPTLHQGIQTTRLLFFTDSFAKKNHFFQLALMTVLAGSAMNSSKRGNHAIVKSVRDITKRTHIWKLPYIHSTPAQADRNLTLKQPPLNSEPFLRHQQAESRRLDIRFHLS